MERNIIIKQDLIDIINSGVDWSQFNGQSILISGANGFLPAYIVKSILYYNQLNSANISVIALVRNRKKTEERFCEFLDSIQIIEHDFTKPINFSIKVDFIIHAASQASPKFYGIDPIGTIEANALGTYHLLNFAKKQKLKSFLYFSSGEVYGVVDESKIPIKEQDFGYIDSTNVRACYGESKRIGENMCVGFHHQYEVPTKIVRPFHTYGPGMTLDDGRVFADFVRNVVHKENIIMNSDGLARRAFCYIADATEAFFKILLNGINGEAYNMGNPSEEYSIKELAEIIIQLKPEYNLSVVQNYNYKDSNLYLKSPISRNSPNIDKIKELGWMPKTTVKEGFEKTINSFL